MIFARAALDDVWIIDPERRADPRGYFARTYCAEEFAAHGLPTVFPQCNTSYNEARGTLRGMHWQEASAPEGKLVRCTRGSIFDVVVDLRPGSSTLNRWIGLILSADNGRSLYIPPGFAHGYQTLSDQSDVFYQMTAMYVPGLSRGARWNDPTFAIDWPLSNPLVSDRDASHPLRTALVE